MVTYDLRGHGNSDEPLDPARYRDSKAWGDEVQAVMDAAGLKRPVLVGWSYAGRVATEVMSKLKLPVLVTHGAEDRNSKVGNAKYTASVIPGAKLSIYEGIGHAPFYEDAARFNTELTAFVGEANRRN